MSTSGAGRLMFGNYRLVYLIGETGMSSVWLGAKPGAPGSYSPVVIKRLRLEATESNPAQVYMKRELQILSELDHRRIVKATGSGLVDREFFIELEYIVGVPVSRLIKELVDAQLTLPLPIALEITIALCDALDYAHSRCDMQGRPRKIVHRDVKPDNIMINHHGEVKLLDFGVARGEHDLDKTTFAEHDDAPLKVVGTKPYMAPEQREGLHLDARADVYAVGLVLFELLTLRRAYPERDPQALKEAVLQGLALSRLEQIPNIPERASLLALLRRVLARERETRLSSARELQLALEHIQERLMEAQRSGRLLTSLARALNRSSEPELAGMVTLSLWLKTEPICSRLRPAFEASERLRQKATYPDEEDEAELEPDNPLETKMSLLPAPAGPPSVVPPPLVSGTLDRVYPVVPEPPPPRLSRLMDMTPGTRLIGLALLLMVSSSVWLFATAGSWSKGSVSSELTVQPGPPPPPAPVGETLPLVMSPTPQHAEPFPTRSPVPPTSPTPKVQSKESAPRQRTPPVPSRTPPPTPDGLEVRTGVVITARSKHTQVYLDGVLSKADPLSKRRLDPGEHTIEYRTQEGGSQSTKFTVNGDEVYTCGDQAGELYCRALW